MLKEFASGPGPECIVVIVLALVANRLLIGAPFYAILLVALLLTFMFWSTILRFTGMHFHRILWEGAKLMAHDGWRRLNQPRKKPEVIGWAVKEDRV